MPDWLTRPFAGDAQLPAFDAEMRLLAALGFGFLIALIYRAVRGPRAARHTLLATLVLLTVLIAMTTIVIGDNVARAFAIVGALSIVRFRTVVEDTRDTAFVIFAVGVGLAVGAGYLVVPLLTLPIAFVAAFAFRAWLEEPSPRDAGGIAVGVTVRYASDFAAHAELASAIAGSTLGRRLRGIGTARAGAAIEETHEATVADELAMRSLAAAVRAVPGVLSVEVQVSDR